MTVPSTIADLYQRVVFAYDFETVYASGGVRYLKDMGPSSFDMQFPGGAADPTIGDGFFSYDGGDYLSLPAGQLARFYAKMPTRECVWLVTTALTNTGTAYVFSTFASGGGNNFGWYLGENPATAANSMIVGWFNGTPAVSQARSNSTILGPGRKRSCSLTIETTPRLQIDSRIETSFAWGVGAFATCVYDVASTPRIGMTAAGGGPITGNVYYLCLLDTNGWSLDYATMSTLSKLMRSGVKPFCGRAL